MITLNTILNNLEPIRDQYIRTNALHKACASGDIAEATRLLDEEGADVDQLALVSDDPALLSPEPPFYPFQDAITPLMVACAVNKFALVQLLIAHGADVKKRSLGLNPTLHETNDDKSTALGYCIMPEEMSTIDDDVTLPDRSDPSEKNTQLKIAELLLQKGADPTQSTGGFTPFSDAAADGNNDLVELFLKYHHSSFLGHPEEENSEPLYLACGRTEKNPVPQTLIDHEINPAKSPKFLLNREINPLFNHQFLPNNLSMLLSTGSFNPLTAAVKSLIPENIEPLLIAGAKIAPHKHFNPAALNPGILFNARLPNLPDLYVTPLDVALDLEKFCYPLRVPPELKEKILALFKEHTAYMYKKDQNGDYPIEHALKHGKYKAVQFLIDNGSPLFSVREEILAYLAEKNNQAWINFIQRRGKEVPPLELDHIGPFDYLPRADGTALKRKAESSSAESSSDAEHVEKKQKLPEGETE